MVTFLKSSMKSSSESHRKSVRVQPLQQVHARSVSSDIKRALAEKTSYWGLASQKNTFRVCVVVKP